VYQQWRVKREKRLEQERGEEKKRTEHSFKEMLMERDEITSKTRYRYVWVSLLF